MSIVCVVMSFSYLSLSAAPEVEYRRPEEGRSEEQAAEEKFKAEDRAKQEEQLQQEQKDYKRKLKEQRQAGTLTQEQYNAQVKKLGDTVGDMVNDQAKTAQDMVNEFDALAQKAADIFGKEAVQKEQVKVESTEEGVANVKKTHQEEVEEMQKNNLEADAEESFFGKLFGKVKTSSVVHLIEKYVMRKPITAREKDIALSAKPENWEKLVGGKDNWDTIIEARKNYLKDPYVTARGPNIALREIIVDQAGKANTNYTESSGEEMATFNQVAAIAVREVVATEEGKKPLVDDYDDYGDDIDDNDRIYTKEFLFVDVMNSFESLIDLYMIDKIRNKAIYEDYPPSKGFTKSYRDKKAKAAVADYLKKTGSRITQESVKWDFKGVSSSLTSVLPKEGSIDGLLAK